MKTEEGCFFIDLRYKIRTLAKSLPKHFKNLDSYKVKKSVEDDDAASCLFRKPTNSDGETCPDDML